MFNFKIVEGRNRKKDKFEIFFICYTILILFLTFFIIKYCDPDSDWKLLFILSRFLWIILFLIFIIMDTSSKGLWVVNRLERKVKVSSFRNSSSLISDSPIVTQYMPPKWINAAEAWLLLHRYASSTDMFSLLYLWSSEQFITIRTENEWWKEIILLTKIKELPDETPRYQSIFFKNLFCESKECRLTELSEIHNYYDLFYLEKYWVSKWWFKDDMLLWLRIPSWRNFIFFCLFLFVLCLISVRILLIFLVLCYLYKKFRRLKRTEKWDELVEHLLWFRKFVLSCDEKKFEHFLKEDPLYYDELLSYAVVFWMETDLMKKLIPVLDKDIVPNDWTYWTWKRIGKFKK